jgi:hypothetical protein
VLLPIYGMIVPFHITTIKNVTSSQVGLGVTCSQVGRGWRSDAAFGPSPDR